jgi:hypothetical protein
MLKEASKASINASFIKEKSMATIELADSFFGADEWKEVTNPNQDMQFQKFILAPNPAYTIEIVGSDHLAQVQSPVASPNQSINIQSGDGSQNTSRPKLTKGKSAADNKISKIQPVPGNIGKKTKSQAILKRSKDGSRSEEASELMGLSKNMSDADIISGSLKPVGV